MRHDCLARTENQESEPTDRQQRQKVEAIGRLAGGIAHDFNNLLTVILGYSELVLASLDPTDPRHQDLGEVRRAALSADALTRQLLAFSRSQAREPDVLSLNGLILERQKMLRRLLSEDVDFRTELSPDCWNVEADPGRLEQVLINLVVNACDAMPQGGRLTIATRNVEWTMPASDSERSVMPSGDYAVLSVSDSGEGMAPEIRSKIFEPFFTTKGIGRGTGLGLSTVYGIVKQSGGYIWVESRPAQGASFEVYLPRTRREHGSAASERRSFEVTGSETILLAEDDDTVRGYARRILREAGYRVLEARDGAEALELSDRHAGEIQMLITDVVMPSLSGPELVQCVGYAAPEVKFLFVSGHAREAVDRHGLSTPEVPLLRKPFAPADLKKKVREVLDGSAPLS